MSNLICEAQLIRNKTDTDVDFRLSVSKSKTFDSCKKKYKFNYIDKLPRKTWEFHIFGSFLHQVLENFHAKLLADPAKEKDWDPVLDESWDEAKKEFDKDLLPEHIVNGRKIIKTYREILNEDGLPNVVSVEENFNIVVENKVLLNGFIDLVKIDPDGMLHVADYKTTKDKKYLQDYFQLETYAYSLFLKNPDLKRIRASYVALRHDFDYLTQEFTREEILESHEGSPSIAQQFIDYTEEIEAEKMWRANPQFLCKFCDFLEKCPEGERFLIRRGIVKKGKPVIGMVKW